jgi:HD-like signal output (HDOD) protein
MDPKLLHILEDFPPLRKSIERINELCKAPDVDILAVARAIEADPMLFSNLLRVVNAPFYGFHSQITSVRHALTLFGVPKVHGLILQFAAAEYGGSDLKAYGVTMEQWLETMRLQQEFLFHLLQVDDDPAAFIKLSGVMFVLEIGKLTADYILEQTGKTHRFTAHEPLLLREEERRVIGATGDELAAQLFEQWEFEAEFIDLFRHSMDAEHASEYRRLAAMLQIARTLLTIYGLQPLENVDALIADYGLNREHIASSYAYIEEHPALRS